MSIESILKSLPRSPWVYQFFDDEWNIIYIGKSINLKSRVNSYFNGKWKLNFAKQKMVKQISDIKYIITTNETESLILETNLIKEYSPKYNVLMKDGKNHVYIKITNELVPKIIKTRIKWKTGTYFWPYLSTNYVNNVLKLLQKVFGYRLCNISFNLNESWEVELKNIWWTKVPCIYYYIKRCSGPCLKEKEKIDEYIKNIEEIKKFLAGDTAKIKQDLELEMKEKASKLEFEEAGKIKEVLDSLDSMEQTQIVRDWVSGDFNVVNYISKFDKFYIALIEIRNSKITGFYNFEIEDKLKEDDENLVRIFVENEYIKNSELGNKIVYLLPFPIDFEWLDIKMEIPQIWVKKDLLLMAYKNIYEYAYKAHLDSLSTKWFTKKNMQGLLEILWYQVINKDIVFECNDISHISGSHKVASRSVIENWKTANSKYRKFKIKSLEDWKIDDFASMAEIIERRLLEIKKTSYIPDLIVIDWWKWQLSAVLKVVSNFLEEKQEEEFKELIKKLQFVAIAEREDELFIIRDSAFEKFDLEKDSQELRMIQKLRDEAHRFAISFNRDTRIKSQKKNILESLPWIWEKTRKKLLKKYWSVEKLKWVSKEELKEILNKNQIEVLENHMII